MTIQIKVIIGVAIIAVIVLVSVTAIAFLPVSFPGLDYGPQIEFKVEIGDGLNTIAENLHSVGLIRSRLAFKIYSAVSGNDKNLQAGVYKLSTNNSVPTLVSIIANGLTEDQSIAVTIPEGSNINDIDLIFATAGLTEKGDFLKADFINREGYLFPDTYKFLPNTSPDKLKQSTESIASRLSDNFNLKTSAIFKTRNQSADDIRKTVIIASMLEKEVKTKEDMALVAGIIQKRMTLGMLLQLDATVAYGECLEKFRAGVNCEVSQANIIEGIKRAEPYNTYKYKGLPPGAISNPGIQAIEAVLNPIASDYLFYLTDKAGNVYYAKTSLEHARNRAKYLNK